MALVALSLTVPRPFPLVSHSQLPLSGRRVLVTAPRLEAAPLLEALVQAGARPQWRAAVDILPLAEADYAPFDEELMRLTDYQLLMLPTRHAVDAVTQRSQNLGDASVLALMLRASSVEIATPGSLAAYVAEQLQTAPSIVPVDSSPRGFAEVLSQLDILVEGCRVLLPAPEPVQPEHSALRKALEEQGAAVESVAAYRAESELAETDSVESELELASLARGELDAVCLSSPQEARALCAAVRQCCPGATLPLVLAIGSDTENVVRELGIDGALVVDARGGIDAAVEALEQHFGAGRLLF